MKRVGGTAWPAPVAALFAAAPRPRLRVSLRTLRITAAVTCVLGAGVMSLLFVEYLAGRAEIRAAKMAQIEARTKKVEDAQKIAEAPADTAAPVTGSIVPNPRPAKQKAATQVAAAEQAPARPRRSSSFFAPSQAMADTFDDDPLADAPPLMAYAGGGSNDGNALAGEEPMGDAGMAELPETIEAKPASAERTAAVAPAPEKAVSGGASGSIVRAVTMRAKPAKGAKAIGVVPAKTKVQLFECNSWCRIQFDGKTGWIYKSFVRPS